MEQVIRLDPAWAVAALREQAGVDLVVEGPCPGGQVGAAYVRRADGHRSVLTWQPGQRVAQLRGRQLAALEVLRRRGYPAPEIELAVDVPLLDGGTAVLLVQELLPGLPLGRVDSASLEQALALNGQQRGVLADREDVPGFRLHLSEDGPGFCLHETLVQHSPRTAALERWVRRVAEELGDDVLHGTDVVHGDFQPTNLLAVDGTISGVVDWDGAARGDRRLDLVTLRFGLGTNPADEPVVRRLDAVLDAIPPEVLRPAWAHMSLRMVDWAIRHFPPGAAQTWLDLAERRTD